MKTYLLFLIALVSFSNTTAQSTLQDPVPFPLNYYDHPVFTKAKEYSKALDWSNAERYWEEFALRFPDAHPRYLELAVVKLALNKYDDAKQLFEEGYLMNPFDYNTLTQYVILCAITGDHQKGMFLADQLGRICDQAQFDYLNYYYTEESKRYTTPTISNALLKFKGQLIQSFNAVGPMNPHHPVLQSVARLHGKTWEEILDNIFSLKAIFKQRGIAPGAYHWFLADKYDHIQLKLGAKGGWVYTSLIEEMVREYESNSDMNVYYKAEFGNWIHDRMESTGDFDRAYALNSKLIGDVSESKLFRFKLIELYTNRVFTLYNLDQFNELNQVTSSLNTVLKEYKNPQFKARAYEAFCAAFTGAGDSPQALEFGEEALDIIRRNKFTGENRMKSLLSISYINAGNIDKALEMAGASNADGVNGYISLYNIGSILRSAGKNEEAIDYFKKSLSKYKDVSQNYSTQEKLTSRARLSLLYSELATANHKLKRKEDVFNVLEEYKANTLAKKMGGAYTQTASLSAIQNHLQPNDVYINIKLTSDRDFLAVVVTKGGIETHFFNVNALIQPIKKYLSPGLKKLDEEMAASEYRLSEYKPVGQDVDESSIPIHNVDLMLVSELYRKALTGDLGKYLELAPDQLAGITNTLAKGMAEHFVNYSTTVTSAKTIYISADGPLHFLPFETFVDKENYYLGSKHHIKMIPSATILGLLKTRVHPSNRKEVLAFGGATYEEAQSNASVVNSIKEINEWQLKSYNLASNGQSLTDLFKAMGYGKMTYLPGTLSEVESLKNIFANAEVVTGSAFTEKRIKDMSASGTLDDYKVLHFATHGWVVNSMPAVAGLATTIPAVSTDGEDGRLIGDEVEKLNIKADMVMLSACQTGLGKLYGGEGVSGLSQSFMAAGANSTIVSLWPVNDYATSILVQEMYRLVSQGGITYADALRQVKMNFIAGKYNTPQADLSKPIYWAPFIYIGM